MYQSLTVSGLPEIRGTTYIKITGNGSQFVFWVTGLIPNPIKTKKDEFQVPDYRTLSGR